MIRCESSPVKSSELSLTAVRGRAKYLDCEASVVYNCNHNFLAALSQSSPDTTKVLASERVEFPNNLFRW